MTTVLQEAFPPGWLLSCPGQERQDNVLERWCSQRLVRLLYVSLQMMISIHIKWYNSLFAYGVVLAAQVLISCFLAHLLPISSNPKPENSNHQVIIERLTARPWILGNTGSKWVGSYA